MLDIVHDVIVPGDEPAQRGEGLAECAHDQIDVLGHAEVGRRAATAAHDAQTVRVVDHEAGPVRPADLDQPRERGQVAAHTEHPVHDDHPADFLVDPG